MDKKSELKRLVNELLAWAEENGMSYSWFCSVCEFEMHTAGREAKICRNK